MHDEPRLDRSGRKLVFEDTFRGAALDETRWIPAYLPHWSTPDRTAARYETGEAGLRLRIDADQPPWCPELDGDLRVSSIQTATFSGPAGSPVGTHPFHPDARVRTPQPRRLLYAPKGGLIEVRMRAIDDPRAMVAFWMIGIGDRPERSGEICVAEIFGRNVRTDRAAVGMGIHPFEDPALTDDFAEVVLPIDVRDPHTYSVDWRGDRVDWFVDDRHVRTVEQAPRYPLQLMLGLYELPSEGADPGSPERPRPVFDVAFVRGFGP
jgi:glycosyl hydrolase family 16